MEANRFDRFSRQVGEQTDRRTILKTAAGGTLALLGMGALASRETEAKKKRGRRNGSGGLDGDACDSNTECENGLRCEGNTRGILGGIGGNYGPPGVDLPILTGKSGRCRYMDTCGAQQGQACQKNSDCCHDNGNGQELICKNRKCKRKN